MSALNRLDILRRQRIGEDGRNAAIGILRPVARRVVADGIGARRRESAYRRRVRRSLRVIGSAVVAGLEAAVIVSCKPRLETEAEVAVAAERFRCAR